MLTEKLSSLQKFQTLINQIYRTAEIDYRQYHQKEVKFVGEPLFFSGLPSSVSTLDLGNDILASLYCIGHEFVQLLDYYEGDLSDREHPISYLDELGMPKIVVAERAGKIPSNWSSWNYRDDMREKGISVLSVNGKKPKVYDDISFGYFDDDKIYYYLGILLPFWGSDGEYLLTAPIKITKQEYKEFLKTIKPS